MRQWRIAVVLIGVALGPVAAAAAPEGRVVTALAVEMPKLVAPTVWEIKLRRGVKFHNGEDFNAESVKFSLERLANPANKLRGSTSFAPLDRVEIVDPFTVKVHTKKPWPVFVAHLALG